MPQGNITFAKGRNALFHCPRCGFDYPYSQKRRDGQNKNWVCIDCWDPKHPQEIQPKNIYDAIALRHPRTGGNDFNRETEYQMFDDNNWSNPDTTRGQLIIYGSVGVFAATVS